MEDQLSLTVTIKPNDGNVAVIITYPEEQQNYLCWKCLRFLQEEFH